MTGVIHNGHFCRITSSKVDRSTTERERERERERVVVDWFLLNEICERSNCDEFFSEVRYTNR